MEKKEVKTYIFIGLLLILIYTSFKVIQPFINALITSCILAYLFYPIYEKIKKLIKNEHASSAITLLVVIVIFLIPFAIISNSIIKEVIILTKEQSILDDLITKISVYNTVSPLSPYLESLSTKAITYLANLATDVIINIPGKIINLVIIIFAVFYLLMKGENVKQTIIQLLPFKDKERVMRQIKGTAHSVVKGMFIIAILEFLIAAIGLTILGISVPILIAFFIGVVTFVPIIGPFIILLPLMFFAYFNNNLYVFSGLIILWLILSLGETFLRPKIIGDRAKINPVIILMGIIGGINIFGIVGIIAGPIILSLMITLIKDYYPSAESNTDKTKKVN